MTRSSFVRLDASTFRATEHVSGAWRTDEQHVGPALGLLTHLVEADRDARRSDGLVVSRLSFDILGTMPVGVVTARVDVLRTGRTVELVEAVLHAAGRDAVRLRAWLLQPGATDELAGSAHPRMPPPEELPPWDPTTVWPGGFIAAAEVRRAQDEPGRARCWVRTDVPLLDGEPTSRLAAAAGLLDIANGLTVRVSPRDVAFPNVDLTAHLFAEPQGEWLGFDTTVSFGRGGLGVTSTVLHDVDGPVGVLAQALTVRPLAVPGVDDGPDAQPGPLVRTLEVDGEVFAVRRNSGGGTAYDWTSGPNEGYGFGSSASPDSSEQEHRDSIRGFLSMIDPRTGFIAED